MFVAHVPAALLSSTAFTEQFFYAATPSFTSTSTGDCLVTSKLHLQTPVQPGISFIAMRPGIREEGVNLITDVVPDGNPPDGSSPIAGFGWHRDIGGPTALVVWQAESSTVVPIVPGRLYQFGCVVEHSNGTVFGNASAKCQASVVCN
jgi:hypothetical protein